MKKKIIVLVLVVIICAFVLTACAKYERQEREIKSLTFREENSEYASATFVLGIGSYSSGSINTQYYVLWIKGDAGFYLAKIEVSTLVEVIETNDVPKIVARFNSIDEPTHFKDRASAGAVEGREKIFIYVPIGTIKADFSLTVEGK